MKTIDTNYKITETTYDEFKKGDTSDKYNCVMMLLMENDLTADDLKMQQDQYTYYATVPIIHWGVSQALGENKKSMEGITNFIKTNL